MDGILTLQTGLPFSVLAGVDRSLIGVAEDHANVNGPVAVYNGRGTFSKIAKYFNTSAFSLPPLGTFGTSGRNTIYAPGTENLDAGLFKNIPIHEQLHLELRWETFNTLNHPNFSAPTTHLAARRLGALPLPRAAESCKLRRNWSSEATMKQQITRRTVLSGIAASALLPAPRAGASKESYRVCVDRRPIPQQ